MPVNTFGVCAWIQEVKNEVSVNMLPIYVNTDLHMQLAHKHIFPHLFFFKSTFHSHFSLRRGLLCNRCVLQINFSEPRQLGCCQWEGQEKMRGGLQTSGYWEGLPASTGGVLSGFFLGSKGAEKVGKEKGTKGQPLCINSCLIYDLIHCSIICICLIINVENIVKPWSLWVSCAKNAKMLPGILNYG